MAHEQTEESGLTQPVPKKKKERSYHQYLVQLKEILPILSVILVFLGYWNLDSYYDHFGIEIYNYVTVPEILLSFLPVIKDFLVILILALALVVILNFTFERLGFYTALIMLMIIIIVFGVINPFGLAQNPIKEIQYYWTLNQYEQLILYISSYLFLYAALPRKTPKLNYKNFLLITIGAFLYLICSLWKKNDEKYQSMIQSHTPTSILIDNKTISTDSNLVYIGQTQNYIFLRKLKEGVNVIYKMSDIDKLEIEGKQIK